MSRSKGKVISASRRTDIPAFYTEWFMEGVARGFFDVVNPYNKKIKKTEVSCDTVHTIVFWSKNYRPFLRNNAHHTLKKIGYNLYFHFSINSRSDLLEPGVPSLEDRLAQLEQLCREVNPNQIAWRFDPIVFYRTAGGKIRNNLSDFPYIAETAAALGITTCITSFADSYKKIDKRVQYLHQADTNTPFPLKIDMNKKKEIIERMAGFLSKRRINLFLCCEKDMMTCDGEGSDFEASRCISGRLFSDLFGGGVETKRDYGQRIKGGCRCTKSEDIGSYDLHPCFHNCLFCYANPAVDRRVG